MSKSQLLLLTLLVNFVMSIATGIVTVSLLDEAPPTVTQTVNRIVEHTVETIAPANEPAATATAPSEEDLLVAAVSADSARTVNLYADATTSPVLAQGIYLAKSRAVVVITDAALPDNAVIGFPDGSSAQVTVSHKDDTIAIYGFSDTGTLPPAPTTSLLPASGLKQGQAVIALTADGSAVTGIISKVDGDIITTTLPAVPKGAAAVTLSGGLVGISNGTGTFVSAGRINSLLSATNS